MANNRMFLVCNVCHPEVPAEFIISARIQGAMHIGKWYPGGSGDYLFTSDKERIQEFLSEHAHPEIASRLYTAGAGQPNPVRLEYESEDLPKLS